MANIDKGRNKWENSSQDAFHEMRHKDEMKSGRRGKPQVEIYRPGSGPLRKSAHGEEEIVPVDNGRKAKSSADNIHPSYPYDDVKCDGKKPDFSLSQEQLNRTFRSNSDHSEQNSCPDGMREANRLADRLGNMNVSPNRSGTKNRRNSLGQILPSGSKFNSGDARRKMRKPEQALYIPKPLAQAYAERDGPEKSPVESCEKLSGKHPEGREECQMEDWDQELQYDRLSECGSSRDVRISTNERWDGNGYSSFKREGMRRNKFDCGNRGGGGSSGNSKRGSGRSDHCDWRSGDWNREIRQTSEPRALQPLDRSARDTRSVEPQPPHWPDKKPPSGRRGSKDKTSHFEASNIPPRFQKLRTAENGTPYNSGSSTYIAPLQNEPPQIQNQQYPLQQQCWSHTLPFSTRSKGRGRLRPEDEEEDRLSRSLTPDRLLMPPPTGPPPLINNSRNSHYHSQQQISYSAPGQEASSSRPGTSPSPTQGPVFPFSSQLNQGSNWSEPRPPTPASPSHVLVNTALHRHVNNVTSWDSNESNSISKSDEIDKPISKEPAFETTSADTTQKSTSPKTLDWGEEVEQSEREAQLLRRSSSVASFVQPDNSSGVQTGARNKKKRKTRNIVVGHLLHEDQNGLTNTGKDSCGVMLETSVTRSFCISCSYHLSVAVYRKKGGGGGGSGGGPDLGDGGGRDQRSMSRDRSHRHDMSEDRDSMSISGDKIWNRGSGLDTVRNSGLNSRGSCGDVSRNIDWKMGPSLERNRNRGQSGERKSNRNRGSSRNRNRGGSGDRNRNRPHSGDRNKNRTTSGERNKNRGHSGERNQNGLLTIERNKNKGPSVDQNRNRGPSVERTRNRPSSSNRNRGFSGERNRGRGHSGDRKDHGEHDKNRIRDSSRERKRNRSSDRRERNRNSASSVERNKHRPSSNERKTSDRNRNRGPSGERNRNKGGVNEGKASSDHHRRRRGQSRERKMDGRSGLVSPNVAGILVLPPGDSTSQLSHAPQHPGTYVVPQHRQLFDPNNPSKPIIIERTGGRSARDTDIPLPSSGYSMGPGFASCLDYRHTGASPMTDGSYPVEQSNSSRPVWYGPHSQNVRCSFRAFRDPRLILDIERADNELQWILSSGGMLYKWQDISYIRNFLQACLRNLLEWDIKFCERESVEQHMWKIIFHNIIQLLQKAMNEDAENREQYKQILVQVIDEGSVYFEELLRLLEKKYDFSLEAILSSHTISTKELGLVWLALISSQKFYLYLGDLARYREQVNDTSNFGKSRQCYIKAHQINPKNGRPYNQLALLAVYARRKLDAVYYYMRSLMATTPVQSARESLLTLFDETRKKYDQTERKRREEREVKLRERMKEKEGAGVRREVWIHPEGRRKRLHITTSAAQDQRAGPDSEDEELATLSSVEVNKRFVVSYLNIHGKLFTKVGMETFQESALQMLREFRALLQHSPVPLNSNRFLQLLALNMFAIENTQIKASSLSESQLEAGYRPAMQENALIVSLQMFSLILEKCITLLSDCGGNATRLLLGEDLQVLLPAVKIWCDWLLCHRSVWNPPPSCGDYSVGPLGDAWTRMAALVNLLERLDYQKIPLVKSPQEGFEMVRLPEDFMLGGFTPLMSNVQETYYASREVDMEMAVIVLRLQYIEFFGSVFLCGLDPPVLKLQRIDASRSEYISVVDSSGSSLLLSGPQNDSELRVESFSEDEAEGDVEAGGEDSKVSVSDLSQDTKSLLSRKQQLERDDLTQQHYRKYVQAILRDSVVLVEIEVLPHYLVPDTNCFVDYLPDLQTISEAVNSSRQPVFVLMVPLVVLQELEGLARGGPKGELPSDHIRKVAEAARAALAFVRSRRRPAAVKCVTSRGTVVPSAAFTDEEDSGPGQDKRNDDRILATALSLCKSSSGTGSADAEVAVDPGETRRLRRDVVLLTEDRNLRVKALGLDVPVREVPDFMRWAGLG